MMLNNKNDKLFQKQKVLHRYKHIHAGLSCNCCQFLSCVDVLTDVRHHQLIHY